MNKKSKLLYQQYMQRLKKSFKSNPKSLWSYIKGRKNCTSIRGTLSFASVFLNDPQKIVDSFADYFSSVFNKPATITPDIPLLRDIAMSTNQSQIIPSFEEETMHQRLVKLKPTFISGPDGIPYFIVKDCSAVFFSFLVRYIHFVA